MTIITQTISSSITPGTNGYDAGLTISNSGGIILSSGIGNELPTAVYANYKGVSISNYGKIESQTSFVQHGGVAIQSNFPDVISNHGFIYGTYVGILAKNGGFISNNGYISSSSAGIIGLSGSTIENSGTINAAEYGVILASSTLSNGNLIFGQSIGVDLSGQGVITNLGEIVGANIGVSSTGGTIVNRGLISGSTDGILSTGSLDLIIDPGSTIAGFSTNSSDLGQIILQGTALSKLSFDSFGGFTQVTFAQNSKWDLETSIKNIDNGITIAGFAYGDTISLSDFVPISETYVPDLGLVVNNGSSQATIALEGSFSSGNFELNNNEIVALCFALGTKIKTIKNKILCNRPVEDLKIGDTVSTVQSGWQKIRWIGYRSYDGRFISGNHLVLPVTLKRHALAKNVPSRDLRVSPGHGIFISGVLVPAWRLVNGITITQPTGVDHIEYFHIELDTHAVLIAENCPAESFYDNGERAQFQNAATYESLCRPSVHSNPLPRCEQGILLESIRLSLDFRAGLKPPPPASGPLRGFIDEATPQCLRGWAQCIDTPDIPIRLDIFLNGTKHSQIVANQYRPDLRAAGLGQGCHGFSLPGVGSVTEIEIRHTGNNSILPFGPHAQAA